jgi:diguanylate cyclase (GGDEF)-like protein
VGVIALSKLGVNQFSTDDLQTMMIFAGYAAQALVNARSYRRLEEQSSQLARQLESQRKLLDVSTRVTGTLEQEDVLEVVADGLKAVVSYDNLSIYRADMAKQVLVPVLTREEHAEEVARYIIPFGRGLMGWVVEHAEAVLANDALADPRAVQIPGTPPDPEALVVVPLISDGQVTGTMNVGRIGGEEVYFSETDFELVQLFAAQAAVALRNADEHHAMSMRAETDALTGLGNHGAFQRDLATATEAAAIAPPEGGQLGLLMMDLDRFKTYNDRFGHPAGDALLHAVGQALYSATRSDDRVYRYGGDEFTIVLSGVGLAEAQRVAERARRLVAAVSLERGAAPVTITVGVALFPDHGATKDALIATADAVMYSGKQAGGDRVVVPGEAARPSRRKPGKSRDRDTAIVPRRRRSDAPSDPLSPKTTAA